MVYERKEENSMSATEYATFEKTLPLLEQNNHLHARFLNTISLLEYMGARKILKSQKEEKMCSQVLAHAAEEIRHAQSFKKLALKMSAGKLTSYSDDQLLCGKEAREYFQSLDQVVHEELGEDSYSNYLYTTLLIEERANQVYPIYETVLARAGFPGVLKAIVREEDGHLKEILESLKDQDIQLARSGIRSKSTLTVDKMIEFRMFETAAFEKFISSVYRALLVESQKMEGQPSDTATAEKSQPGLTRSAPAALTESQSLDSEL
jgi:rubrerythrin